MATFSDVLLTILKVEGGPALSAQLQGASAGFLEMAAAEGVAAKAAGGLEAALAPLVAPWALIAAGVGLAVKSLQAFSESEDTIGRLAIQMKNLGNTFPVSELTEFAGKLSQLTGIDDELIAKLGATAAQFGLQRRQIEALLPTVLDISTALKKAPEDVLGTLLRASRGRPQGLVSLGIDPNKIKGDLRDVNNLIAQVGKGFAGTAEAFRGTLPGTVTALSSSIGNLFEALGRFISPAVVPVLNLLILGVDKLTALLTALADAFPSLFPTAAKLGEGGKPSDVALKGDPEQTQHLRRIAENTDKLSPILRRVLGGTGEVARGAFTWRDLPMALRV